MEPSSLRRAEALKESLQSGVPGAAAMVAQVVLLMWLRTTTHYQYRHDVSMLTAMSILYNEGGVARFYRGLPAALIQAPLSRFGDTAANAGMLRLLRDVGVPLWLKTAAASGTAAAWRIFLTPVDTVKVIMQVEGSAGREVLRRKLADRGFFALYDGAASSAAATAAAHWPWFLVYNACSARLSARTTRWAQLCQNAAVGFLASLASDCFANSFRVIKTTAQTSAVKLSYHDAFNKVLQEGGYSAFLFRGLGTKIFSNAVQGLCFTVFWQIFTEWYAAGKGGAGKAGAAAAGGQGLGSAAEHAKAGVMTAGAGNGHGHQHHTAVDGVAVAVAGAGRRGGATGSRGARGHSRERDGGGGVGPASGSFVVSMGGGPQEGEGQPGKLD